jgi:hypothetical protein
MSHFDHARYSTNTRVTRVDVDVVDSCQAESTDGAQPKISSFYLVVFLLVTSSIINLRLER